MPAKHEPGSTSAIRLREETSSRFSVRFQYSTISRTSQFACSLASSAS